jgi:DNA-binding PadR family transcriptional regulator
MRAIPRKPKKEELEKLILSLINDRVPLIDFPLLDYSSEEIYQILLSLRNKGYIIITFDFENNYGDNKMNIHITDKGKKILSFNDSKQYSY